MTHTFVFLIGFTWGLVILALLKYIFKKPINVYIGTDVPIKQETPSKPLFKRDKPIPETDEQRRQRILDENVENYDGTNHRQVKI